MLFQEIQDSPWLSIFLVAEAVSVLLVFIILVLVKNEEDDLKRSFLRRVVLVLTVCGLGCGIGMAAVLHQQVSQNNASFSKQLMDEYHATSKRPFTAIKADLFRDHVANDVFTRNGKDTLIAITLVNRDGNKETLEFTVLDGGSPYTIPGSTNK